MGSDTATTREPRKWLPEPEELRGLIRVGLTFIAFVAVDLATRVLSDINNSFLDEPILLVAAFRTRTLAFLGALVGGAVLLWAFRARLLTPWSALDHGKTLRMLVAPLVFLLAWQGSMYEFNFVLGQDHLVDRFLVLAFGVGALVRPLFLIPFVLQFRIINEQFGYPFSFQVAQNIDELAVLAIVAVAAGFLVFLFSGRAETAPVLLVLVAAVGAHFFHPGVKKLPLDWLATNDISNLPKSGYTAGWLGGGDGSWATRLSRWIAALSWVPLLATLVVELGAAVAVINRRLTALWLALFATFHVVLFVSIGFWFISWIALEIGLAIILLHPSTRDWIATNFTPARIVTGIAAVTVGGSFLFHPPNLSWLDAPVSYGYRIEAVGVDTGTIYTVSASAFAPMVKEISFFNIRFDDTRPASGGYGAVRSKPRYLALQEIETFDELRAVEQPSEEADRVLADRFMERFLESANTRGRAWWSPLAPPDHFWTSSHEPRFDFQEPITDVRVFVLRSIHDEGGQRLDEELVATYLTGG